MAAVVDAVPAAGGGWEALVRHAEELAPDPLLADLTDQQVVDQVRRRAGLVASATAQLLVAIGELVVRGLWHRGGAFTTPAQWLSWAIGMAPSTSREHVRVALALRAFPTTRERFLAGTLSYSKVRAITRAGEPGLEAQLLEYADNATAAQLEHVVRTFTGLAAAREDAAPRRRLHARDRGDGTTRFTVDLPTATAHRVMAQLERLLRDLDAAGLPTDDEVAVDARRIERREDDRDRPTLELLAARRADALVHAFDVAVAHLERDLTGSARTTLVLHGEVDAVVDRLGGPQVDRLAVSPGIEAPPPTRGVGDDGVPDNGSAPRASAEAPRSGAGAVAMEDHDGGLLALSRRVLRRLACDPAVVRITLRDGLPIDVGRQQRFVTHALRRALRHRDATCRFPGCAATRHLHAHHIVHWADGGPTDLDNLVLVCGAHHRFLHAHDWTIERAGPNRFEARGPGAVGYLENRLPAVAGTASAEAVGRRPRGLEPPGRVHSTYDLDLAVAILQRALEQLPVARAA